MVRILLSGCNGRMGQAISKVCQTRDDCEIAAGIDINAVKLNNYPVYSDFMEFPGRAGVIVDFSSPACLPSLLSYAVKNSMPVIIATTGLTAQQEELIEKASMEIPVFRSANMSLGVSLMTELAKKAAKILGDAYDIEIVEKHHNTKVDAPSGTALMLLSAVSSVLPYSAQPVYDRHAEKKKRDKQEIGMHSIRGGTIVGEHDIIFAGYDEVIEIKHTALSREVFASGALKAAQFLQDCRRPGMYDMSSVVADE